MKNITGLLRRLTAFAIIACLLIPLIPGEVFASGKERRLTLMVYISGSDLESNSGCASKDINEMLAAHNDPENVSVLVMIGGAEKWKNGFPNDRSVIYELVDGEAVEVWSHELMNMADPNTLTTLLDFGYTNYPAEDYALIMWDHGGGPLNGLCIDENFTKLGIGDILTMDELQEALAASPCAEEPLEWIGMDACLMASVEVAYICSPYAKYLIASQEVEGSYGWDYAFLENIAADPSGAITGIRIVDSYYETATRNRGSVITLSCIDLRRMDGLAAALDTMFYLLADVLDEDSYSFISNMRKDTSSIARTSTDSEYDLIDLYDLAELYYQYYPVEADMLMQAMDDSIIYHRSNIDGLNGLSIYHPYYSKDLYKLGAKYSYEFFDMSKGYLHFMDGYTDIWLSGSLTTWRSMKTVAAPDAAEDRSGTVFTMELTDEQRRNVADAQLYVMTYDENLNLYSFAYSTNEVELQGNTLIASYDSTALYILDENGRPLTGSLEYTMVEDTYRLRAVLCEGEDMLDGEALPVYIVLKRVPGTDMLEVTDVINASVNENGLADKQDITLDPLMWKNIYIAKYPVSLVSDENGDILPFTQWEDSDWVVADFFSNEQEWTVSFVDESYVTDSFVAMFVVKDTQGNEYGSDLVEIENTNLIPAEIETGIVTDNEFVTIEVTGANYSTAGYDPGLIVKLDITNNTDRTVRIYANKFIIGDVAMANSCTIADGLLPGSTVSTSLMLYTDDLEEGCITSMPSLTFDLNLIDTVEYDSVADCTVTIDSPVDLAPLFENSAAVPSPVSTPVPGEVSAELFDIAYNTDGTVSARIRYVNDTDHDYDTYVNDVIINGCVMSGVMPHSLWLPAGTTTFGTVTITPSVEPDMWYISDLPQLSEPFAYWGVCDITDMRLMVTNADYDYDYIDVYLPEEIRFENVEAQQHDDTLLYSADGVTIISRGTPFVYDGTLNLTLIVKNELSDNVTIEIMDSTIDSNYSYTSAGTDVDGGFLFLSDINIPADTATRCILGFDVSNLEPGSPVEELAFTIYNPAAGGSYSPVTVYLPAGTTVESLTAK